MGAYVQDELFLKAPTKVGLLADVSKALGDAGVSIEAIGAYDKEGMGEFYLITSDNVAAEVALSALPVTIQHNDVVVAQLDDRPGSLADAAALLREGGVNVDWVYATVSGGGPANVIFKTSDPPKTAELLGA